MYLSGALPSRAANSGYNPRVCREQRRAKLRNKVENGGVSLVFRSGYLHGDHREGKQREIAMTGESVREICLVGITTMCGVGFSF